MVGAPIRQDRVLAAVAERLAGWPEILGALVVGSLAAGTADAASDVDLIVCTRPGQFDAAWQRRRDLPVTGVLTWWDDGPEAGRQLGVHRWVTDDMVLVEALFAAPGSGMRLARPWRVVVGDAGVASSFTPRPPVDRAEFNLDAHPIDRAFDDLKRALRAADGA